MPDFTVSLTAPQAQRVAAAFSFLTEDGGDANAAQVQAWIKQQIRRTVLQAEHNAAAAAAVDTVDADMAAEGWNV